MESSIILFAKLYAPKIPVHIYFIVQICQHGTRPPYFPRKASYSDAVFGWANVLRSFAYHILGRLSQIKAL